jgi:hypothetical protein
MIMLNIRISDNFDLCARVEWLTLYLLLPTSRWGSCVPAGIQTLFYYVRVEIVPGVNKG